MASHEGPIRVVLINGSARPGNYTGKALALVVDEFKKDPRVSVEVVEARLLNLPLPGTAPNHPATMELQRQVKEATAVVLATPEYHGSFSSLTKLVIENLGFPSVLAGKPVALLGVAAGTIGAIKSLEALRGVVSHIGGLALPMPVSVANVQKVFDEQGRCLDADVERYVRGLAKSVMDYLEQHVCPLVTLERILREGVTAAA